MDIQAPYITQMERKGYCDEYDAYYGINRRKSDDDSEECDNFDRDRSEWDD